MSAPLRPGRKLLVMAVAALLGLVLALALAEGVLRLLPVADQFLAENNIDAQNPLIRFKKSGAFTFSRGFGFDMVNRVRTNNDGFVNDQDYTTTDPRPLLAVVGDSYVEAAMVPYPQTLQGRLAQSVDGHGRVYSFGASGSQLPTYLAYARYARDTYRPQGLVIVIVGNDFDESHIEFRNSPGLHYFEPGPGGELRMRLVEYRPAHPDALHAIASRLGLGRLALVRHWRNNWPSAAFQLHRLAAFFSGQNQTSFVGQTASMASPHRVELSKRCVDAFFRLLPEYAGLPPERIVLVVDGLRPELYDPLALAAAQGSFVAVLRAYFMEQGQRRGFEIIDMQPVFMDLHKKDGRVFEFKADGHWSGGGHAAAAEEVEQSRMFRAVFAPPAP